MSVTADSCLHYVVDADMSEKTDSWGWATTMLSMMGMLDAMKVQGYRKFVAGLVHEGFKKEMNGMFDYEYQVSFFQ